MGAAIQGGLIAGVDVGPVLVDITPHTLGIQALSDRGGRLSHYCFVPLIGRNSPLPCRRSEMFHTASDRQKVARIAVFQGEDDDVRRNDLVGEFLLEGLAEVDAGNEVLVQFDLNLDGILQVRATEHATGRQKELTIDNAVSRFRAARGQTAEAGTTGSAAVAAAAPGGGAADGLRADAMLAASRPAAPAGARRPPARQPSSSPPRCPACWTAASSSLPRENGSPRRRTRPTRPRCGG